MSRLDQLREKAAKVGLEVSRDRRSYTFSDPATEEYITLTNINQAEAFADGLLWGNRTTRPGFTGKPFFHAKVYHHPTPGMVLPERN